MNKENTLFGIVGLLAGLIIGFMVANSINRSAVMPASAPPSMSPQMQANSNMPPGHPDIGGQNPAAMMPEIQAAVDKAKQNPSDFEAQIKAAELYYQIERYAEASEFLKAANKLKPDHYETIVQLGNATFDNGKFEEAEKWYSAALTKKADDVNVRTDLGLTFVFRENPNYERAIQEFNKSLEINPKHTQTLQNMVFAYTRKGDAAKATETLAKLEAADPANPALSKLKEGIQEIGSKK